MTERLPNNNETGWGDILGANDGTGGFLRVAFNDDGTLKDGVGGFAIGSSYLLASAATASGVSSTTDVPYALTLDDSAGSDFAIDGGDSTKVNVLNDCWAVITVSQEVEAESATLTQITVWLRGGDGLSTEILYDFDEGEWTVREFHMTTCPIALAAGDIITATIRCATSAGTYSFGSIGHPSFQIVRVA